MELEEKKSRKDREDERKRSKGGNEGLNFNPGVTEFTDIWTTIRLAVPRSFSEMTLSLLSVLSLILPPTFAAE